MQMRLGRQPARVRARHDDIPAFAWCDHSATHHAIVVMLVCRRLFPPLASIHPASLPRRQRRNVLSSLIAPVACSGRCCPVERYPAHTLRSGAGRPAGLRLRSGGYGLRPSPRAQKPAYCSQCSPTLARDNKENAACGRRMTRARRAQEKIDARR